MMAIVSGSVRRFPETKVALNKYAQEFINQLKKNLISLDKVATKKLIRSLNYKIVEPTANNYTILLQAENYFYWVDKGRNPGRFPPIKPLEEWAKAKRVQFRNKKNGRFLSYRQTAFIVARSLTKKKIQPTNVLKNTISEMLNRQRLLLKAGFRGDIQKLISDTFQDIKNNQ